MKDIKDTDVVKETLIENEFRDFILDNNHPCVMANAIFLTNNYHLKVYDSITNLENVSNVLLDIQKYLENYNFDSNEFESLIVCFKKDQIESELTFEKQLWQFLQEIHNQDDFPWDPTVSADPSDPDFSFSIKGKAFYIIGMHPGSSRLARRAPYCTIVFNMHWQFEKLREMGIYQKIKNRIRKQDRQLQGSINPVLRDFGKETETRQYSGREVEKNWQCPFHKTK